MGKKESIRDAARRLGFPDLTPEQERRNLEYNLGVFEAERCGCAVCAREARKRSLEALAAEAQELDMGY